MLRLVYTCTLFVSAALLFVVQPMIGKMVLPLLGGTPAVWITCMVFFQAVLLAGYLYAHLSSTWLGTRRQAAVHLAVLALPLLALPFMRLPLQLARGTLTSPTLSSWLGSIPTEGNPTLWLLGLLLLCIGLPFFAVSTSAPLLQKWFASTGHPDAVDPYFLYGASNLGSMLALLGYPVVVEPYLHLPTQTLAWSIGYGVLLVMTALCAVCLWRAKPPVEDPVAAAKKRPQAGAESPTVRITAWMRVYWVALAFVPSSLLLAVTTYMSTDLAAIPLLWVVPLALYLLTFILVFSRGKRVSANGLIWLLPVLMAGQLLFLLKPPLSLWPVLVLHLVTFFVASMVCHGELARSRPATRHLTGFYLWMSFGGVLGGLFSAVAAPLIFNSVAEYPLLLALACLLGPAIRLVRKRPLQPLLNLAVPAACGLLAAVAMVQFLKPSPYGGPHVAWSLAGLTGGVVALVYVGVACFSTRPLLFGLGVGCVLLAATVTAGRIKDEQVLYQKRTFFSVLRVTYNGLTDLRRLYHGTTVHGAQSLDRSRRDEPLMYYQRQGPLGAVFAALRDMQKEQPIAVVGLGTGAIACYGSAGQEMDFFDIDPEVAHIAGTQGYFTFLQDSPANIRVMLGDGRLSLLREADNRYGLIVLDAFSSDAIPVHLITREAVRAVYLSKLKEGGMLAFHITNRYLDLQPVLADVARAAGLVCMVCDDAPKIGKPGSVWVVMAARAQDLGTITADPRWQTLAGDPGRSVWTDDFSNVLATVQWR